MRKHSVRKWIHAILDMLPLVVIPIFAIYSHRHNIDGYSVTRTEPIEVNVFQYVENGKPYNFNLWSYTDCYSTFVSTSSDNFIYVDITGSVDFEFTTNVSNANFNVNDVVYLTYNVNFGEVDEFDDFYVDLFDSNGSTMCQFFGFHNGTYFDTVSCDYSFVGTTLRFGGMSYVNNSIYLNNLMLFNLTNIFGSGNEPSKEVFNSYLVNDYYDYGNNTLNVGTHDVTYNDTDIGSQFMYEMYNVTNKYFNFNSVGNFNDIYGWFETNLFGGNAPMSFFIVWNIILYEFIMDLIFLTYMLFMFIIDFAEHLIDCFFDKSYRGGR